MQIWPAYPWPVAKHLCHLSQRMFCDRFQLQPIYCGHIGCQLAALYCCNTVFVGMLQPAPKVDILWSSLCTNSNVLWWFEF